MQRQSDADSQAYSYYRYLQNSGAAAPPFASAPPVSASDYSSSHPYFPSNVDHGAIPPVSSDPYSFPHNQHASSDNQHEYHQNPGGALNYGYAFDGNANPSLTYNSSINSEAYLDAASDSSGQSNELGNSVSYGGQGFYDGGIYKYTGGQVGGGRSSAAGTGGGTMFDDYGRPIGNSSAGKELGEFGSSLPKVVKAAPKAEEFQDAKSGGAQKFRVKLLSEGYGQTDMDVLCQIGLDGIRILDPGSSSTLRIYPLYDVSKWEVLDSYIFAFWASNNVDPELKRIRLKSSSYTTTHILDLVTAASIQSKEIGPSSSPSEVVKTEPSSEKKKGFIDWKNLIKPMNEEKEHWVPDEVVSKCSACASDFNAFNRKHHCRNCGDIFCDKCTQGRIALNTDVNAQAVRVCDRCMAEVTQRLSNIKEAPTKASGLQSHEDLARKIQEEMDKKRKTLIGMKSEASDTRMREVACPTCTVHLQVLVPTSGSETIECSVCQHPFLVNAY